MHGERLTPQQQGTLAERIRRHEPSAEEELVRLFSNRVAFLVSTRTRDREAARDLTQDVMLAVVLALRDGHLREPERLAAFVYGTARNVVNNYLRTRSRLPREDSIDAESHLASIAGPARKHRARRFGATRAQCPRFNRSQNPVSDAGRGSEAWRNCDAARPDAGSRANPEVARDQKSDRACEKTVTKMSENTTNSSKRKMDCGRVAREEILEGYLGGRLTEEDREAFEEHYFECARCFDELRTLQAIREELRRAGAEFEAQRTTSVPLVGPRCWARSRRVS